ncbi:hypothetical protein ACIBF6_14055 [Streptosporangium amethystogenes]|uniref:hypothetical protein n=1 Tax=Streptosporangium amethystogenes TaxID=2002 RepID=UPI0037AB58FB
MAVFGLRSGPWCAFNVIAVFRAVGAPAGVPVSSVMIVTMADIEYVEYTGILGGDDHLTMARVLEVWAGGPVRVALHFFGWEIDYDSEILSIYAQPGLHLPPGNDRDQEPCYLLSGSLTTATVAEAEGRLRALIAAFGKVGIGCRRLEYLIVDENGRVLEEREGGIVS